MIVNPPKILHTTPNAVSGKMAPDLQKAYEAAMHEQARRAGMTWDGGTPPPTPQAPLPNK